MNILTACDDKGPVQTAPANQGEVTMLRKITLALVAAATVGAAALAPTSASAWWFDGPGVYHHDWFDWGYRYSYVNAADTIAYCARKYRSYDPASGTFLGNDGMRHYCPNL
jgi:hypothetical protein